MKLQIAKQLATVMTMACATLGLAGCETVTGAAPYEPSAARGMQLARESCASCHEIFLSRESLDPHAPAFRDIVNRPEMSDAALTTWLRDAHNYPNEMGFQLEPHQADSLVAYMLTLRPETGQ